MSAVEKYAEIYSEKIKATALAAWARDNIEGLENVQYYHFTRPFESKKTGKLVTEKRMCTIRIEEYNKTRTLACEIGTNILLHSADIDEFLRLPTGEKRKIILNVRKLVEQLVKQNSILERRNRQIVNENSCLQQENEELKEKISVIGKKNAEMEKKVNHLIVEANTEKSLEALKNIGIFNKNIKFLGNSENDTTVVIEDFSFGNVVKEAKKKKERDYVKDIFGDIDF